MCVCVCVCVYASMCAQEIYACDYEVRFFMDVCICLCVPRLS